MPEEKSRFLNVYETICGRISDDAEKSGMKEGYIKKHASLNTFFLILILSLFVALFYFYRPTQSVYSGCNVILISIDTLRADHVGVYGYYRNTTPNIDSLASQSLVFENVTTQASYTLPSFMSVFTSLYPSVHLVGQNDDVSSLNPSITTVTNVLRNNGYYTAAFIDAPYIDSYYGFSKGFNFFDERSVYNGDGGIANINNRVYTLLQNIKSKKILFVLALYGCSLPI